METKVIRTLVLLMALLSGISQSKASTTDDDEIQPITILKSTSTTRPPRSIVPECYYQSGNVYIIGDSGITSISATVTRLSDGTQWSGSSTTNTLRISVSTDNGTYSLSLTLSDGNSYYGEFTL